MGGGPSKVWGSRGINKFWIYCIHFQYTTIKKGQDFKTKSLLTENRPFWDNWSILAKTNQVSEITLTKNLT